MLGSNFALLVKSPGDDGQQLLTTGSRLVCISLVWAYNVNIHCPRLECNQQPAAFVTVSVDV